MIAPALNLLWVTPLSKRSAIGHFSRLVTDALAAQGVRVTLGSCESHPIKPDAAHLTRLPTLLDPADVVARLDDFDVVIYNIGNNYTYHGALLSQIERRSGIFIFHDLYLHDLFYGLLQARGKLRDHDRIVNATYGRAVEVVAPDAGYGSVLNHRVAYHPMTEWFAPKAMACIVHGRFGVPILQAATAGPVIHVPLAFYDPAKDQPTVRVSPPAPAGREVTVATFGDVNPNKRVNAVIQAIGASAMLRERICYTVIGSVPDSDWSYLHELAASLGVNLKMIGRVDEKEWAERMRATEIVACLRYPTTETASATAIESMLAGLPILVTDTGFYSDLPDDLVFKVDPDREIETVREQLERLVRDPDLRLSAGMERVRWARETFSSARYAERVVALSREVMAIAPAIEVGTSIASTAVLLGLEPDHPKVASWVTTAGALFSGHDAGN